MNMRRTFLFLSICCGPLGCSPANLESSGGDHAEDAVVLEEATVTRDLDASGVSKVFRASEGFVRLGVMWDAADEGALELRTSPDGVRWSAWSRPLSSFSESGAHAGRLDAAGRFYQYRVQPGRAAPAFIAIEPLRSAPEPSADPAAVEQGRADGVGSLVQALDTPIGPLTIHGKSDWGGRAAKCSSPTTTERATIHHTVTPTNDSLSPQARLRQIQSYHMDTQGWCDIGYNYLVSRDGRVWRGRGAGTLGAHVDSNNSGNVGISFMGTYTSTSATATQLCNAAKLLAELHRDHPALKLTRDDVKGHKQYGGTACPGNDLYNQIDDILRKAAGGCSRP
jgi:hypothetical protein